MTSASEDQGQEPIAITILPNTVNYLEFKSWLRGNFDNYFPTFIPESTFISQFNNLAGKIRYECDFMYQGTDGNGIIYILAKLHRLCVNPMTVITSEFNQKSPTNVATIRVTKSEGKLTLHWFKPHRVAKTWMIDLLNGLYRQWPETEIEVGIWMIKPHDEIDNVKKPNWKTVNKGDPASIIKAAKYYNVHRDSIILWIDLIGYLGEGKSIDEVALLVNRDIRAIKRQQKSMVEKGFLE